MTGLMSGVGRLSVCHAWWVLGGLVLVLAPALLGLFGSYTWRLPPWLDRVLPNLGLKE